MLNENYIDTNFNADVNQVWSVLLPFKTGKKDLLEVDSFDLIENIAIDLGTHVSSIRVLDYYGNELDEGDEVETFEIEATLAGTFSEAEISKALDANGYGDA